MSRREFDFEYSCPLLDNNISLIHDAIYEGIGQMLEDLEVERDSNYASEWADWIYNSMEDYIENVRDTNKDMRDSAEEQIQSLNDSIEDLEDEKRDIEFDRDNLETTVDMLQDEKAELEDIIADLKEELQNKELC